MEQLVAREAHNLEVVRSSRAPATKKIHCAVEKLVSREAHNLKIGGSSPSCATKTQATPW